MFDLAAADEVLRRVYAPAIQEMFNRENHLLRFLRDDTAPVAGTTITVTTNAATTGNTYWAYNAPKWRIVDPDPREEIWVEIGELES